MVSNANYKWVLFCYPNRWADINVMIGSLRTIRLRKYLRWSLGGIRQGEHSRQWWISCFRRKKRTICIMYTSLEITVFDSRRKKLFSCVYACMRAIACSVGSFGSCMRLALLEVSPCCQFRCWIGSKWKLANARQRGSSATYVIHSELSKRFLNVRHGAQFCFLLVFGLVFCQLGRPTVAWSEDTPDGRKAGGDYNEVFFFRFSREDRLRDDGVKRSDSADGKMSLENSGSGKKSNKSFHSCLRGANTPDDEDGEYQGRSPDRNSIVRFGGLRLELSFTIV